MAENIKRYGGLLIRILLIPMSALVLLFFLRQFVPYINDIIEAVFYLNYEYWVYVDYLALSFVIFAGVIHFCLEIKYFYRSGVRTGYLLKHLRYGAITAILISIPVTMLFDFAMVEYSRWKISNYIFQSSTDIVKPDIRLHVTDRGWCGNGVAANIKELYAPIASSGFKSEDPNVRVRSLLMSNDVRDILNGNNPIYDDLIFQACRDKDIQVRDMAEKLLQDWRSGCFKYFK